MNLRNDDIKRVSNVGRYNTETTNELQRNMLDNDMLKRRQPFLLSREKMG